MPSIASQLANLDTADRRAVLASLTDAEAAEIATDWRFWARPEQMPPPGDWTGWLIMAGRGWGKTRVGTEAISDFVLRQGYRRVALVGETAADARQVMIEGESGLMNVGPPSQRPQYFPSKRELHWANGAMATTYNGLEPDQLRGPQHDLVYFDELAKFRYAQEAFDQAMFGLRIGERPKWIATTTPRPIKLIRELIQRDGKDVHVTYGRTRDNLMNLAPSFQKAVVERYAGTRLGRQELDAEILDDAPGALWTRRGLDEWRVHKEPALKRIVVAVDPAVTSGENSNESGIIVCGLGGDGHGYVLADDSGIYSPDQLARRVHAAFRLFQADRVVVEVNNGGEMITAVLKSVAGNLPVSEVRATRGKYVRAEPVAALYEQGRVHHVGVFPELEDQMCVFTSDRLEMLDRGESPDRVDALVWGFTELFNRMISMGRQAASDRRGGDMTAIGGDYLDQGNW